MSWNHLFKEKHMTNLFAGLEVNSLERSQNYFQGLGMQYTMGEIPYYVYEFFKKGIEAGEPYYGLTHAFSHKSVRCFPDRKHRVLSPVRL